MEIRSSTRFNPTGSEGPLSKPPNVHRIFSFEESGRWKLLSFMLYVRAGGEGALETRKGIYKKKNTKVVCFERLSGFQMEKTVASCTVFPGDGPRRKVRSG